MTTFKNSMPITRRGAHDTNIAAALRLFPRTGRYKEALVTAHILSGGSGLTDHQAAKHLGLNVAWSTAGATRHGMNKNADHNITPWFVKTDERRINENGNRCIVWQLSPEACRFLGITSPTSSPSQP